MTSGILIRFSNHYAYSQFKVRTKYLVYLLPQQMSIINLEHYSDLILDIMVLNVHYNTTNT